MKKNVEKAKTNILMTSKLSLLVFAGAIINLLRILLNH